MYTLIHVLDIWLCFINDTRAPVDARAGGSEMLEAYELAAEGRISSQNS